MTSLWLRSLRKWKEYVKIVTSAVKRIVPEAQIFLAGGIAEKQSNST